ncbi:hypothetical protein [Spirosoma oryzicola]|uniref:hypothetical protein n=1 Tax=Spirosoma oryzicola TaxID=2898794 RepID=UPI001E368933|nr:hypothetical protein [Spirosoma oryzicola]UHG90099.1 hypothetical protein LQ777_17825 [Spirosoma oryzicola]
MEWITEQVALVTGRNKTAAILQLTESAGRDHAYGTASIFGGNGLSHVPWGNADNQPNTMGVLIQKNNQVRPLLESNRDMIYGTGISFFKRKYEQSKVQLEPYSDSKLDEWKLKTRLANYAIGAINERLTNGNHFTRFQLDLDGLPLLDIMDCYSSRIDQKSTKFNKQYLFNPYFGDLSYYRPKDSEPLPGFNFANPEANIVSVFHSREHMSGNPHYAYPSWWGAADWIELANLIPIFHKSGITNGYNIKYLVRVPKDYFDTEGGKSVPVDKIRQRWSEFSDNLSNWMAGTKNVNKSLILKYMRGEDGKAQDAIDVVPLKNEMSDDAYSKVWEMANVSIANAAGILPTLGGVNPGKGNDSGSQIRVMAEFQQHFRTPVHHQILLEPVQYGLKIMGYKDIVPSFSGVQITTLDVNPTGSQAVINHN